ncbi:MAG: hypothetical protein KAR54_02590 [Candidatus Pacebacteria bacterium]|nr:hypothetical protein [Candidatus Paceibacterota bacterium]
MIGQFKGPYSYTKKIVEDWNSTVIGVYYLGIKTLENKLTVYYIGRAVGEGGIRGRLLQHLNENEWSDITHFGYQTCDTEEEAIEFESEEIDKYKPNHNQIGI